MKLKMNFKQTRATSAGDKPLQWGKNLLIPFSSPEHEVLMVSYCDQSMSVVRRALSVVRRQQFVLKAKSS